jgi:hypothetical protein
MSRIAEKEKKARMINNTAHYPFDASDISIREPKTGEKYGFHSLNADELRYIADLALARADELEYVNNYGWLDD